MRRFVSVMVALLLLIPSTIFNTLAAENASKTDVIYLENGCYISVEITGIDLREAGRKIGHKDYIYYNSDGEEQWRATLTGSFTYTGTSATCTSSSCSVAISDSNWSIVSKTADRSGNSALATVVMEKKFAGVKIYNREVSIMLTCDENGNLS